MDHLALDSLPIFLRGSDRNCHATVRVADGPHRGTGRPDQGDRANMGASHGRCQCEPTRFWRPSRRCFPMDRRCFQGYRLLQEYFGVSQSLHVCRAGWAATAVPARAPDRELEIIVVSDTQDPRLEKAVGPAQFALFCAPAVNPVSLGARRSSHPPWARGARRVTNVVPEPNPAHGFEVHTVHRGDRVRHWQRRETGVSSFFMRPATRRPRPHRLLHRCIASRACFRPGSRAQGAPVELRGQASVPGRWSSPDEAPFRPQLKQLALPSPAATAICRLHLPAARAPVTFHWKLALPWQRFVVWLARPRHDRRAPMAIRLGG